MAQEEIETYELDLEYIPEDIKKAVLKYLEGEKPQDATIKIDDGPCLSKGLRKILEREVARMSTIEDFADKVGEDHDSEQFRHMIPNLKPKTQRKLLLLAYGYKAQKMVIMLQTIDYTIFENEYFPLDRHPNIFRDEYEILESIYWKVNPKDWEKFEKIEKEHYQRNKPRKYDEGKQGKLIRMYDELYETGRYISTSTPDEVEESREEKEYSSSSLSSHPETEEKGKITQ
ncbi:hypothetical protein JTB14_035404 [Gonioctena quinquepunctata]|nr:hypothetical protein JTB14_035404 [Gonioctena quinquepunctata]